MDWVEFHNVSNLHFELLWKIHTLINKINPIKIHYIHFRGHQDRIARNQDKLVQANHEANLIAKRFLKFCMENKEDTRIEVIHCHHCAIQMEGKYICRNILINIESSIDMHNLKLPLCKEKG